MVSVATGAARRSSSCGVIDALNREWCRLESEHWGVVARWSHGHTVFARCSTLDDVLDTVSTREFSDPALHALLEETAAGDQLAGRVVLQSMLGRMVSMARRDRRAGVDDYVAALWCGICCYPLARRPVRISANLALDTLKAVHREHRWLVRGEVTPWPPGDVLDELGSTQTRDQHGGAEVGPGARELLAVARSLELIDDAARSILTSVYVEGLSGAEAASRHGISAGSVRVRCSRAVSRLSRSAVTLAEAA